LEEENRGGSILAVAPLDGWMEPTQKSITQIPEKFNCDVGNKLHLQI